MASDEQGVRLGTDATTGQPIIHPDSQRNFQSSTGIYILGTKGSGKTSLLLNLVLHDIQIGQGLALLDPHGSLIDHIIARLPAERLSDVVYWDIADPQCSFGLNPYHCKSLENDDLTADLILDLFAKMWSISRSDTPRLRNYIRSSALVMLANPGMTMLELRDLFTDQQVCERLLRAVSHKPVRDFWQDFHSKPPNVQRAIVDPLLTRIQEFIEPKLVYYMVGQSEPAFDFRWLLDESKVLLVKLPEGAVGADKLQLLGTMIIGQILAAALSRFDVPMQERVPFHLYVDEFDQFTTPDFAKIINKARQYGIEAIIAHQMFGQLDEEIKAAVKTSGVKVVFSVSPDDQREAAGLFEPVEVTVQEGWEPVPLPHPSVVEYLVRQGTHPDSLVRQYIRDELTPLSDNASDKPRVLRVTKYTTRYDLQQHWSHEERYKLSNELITALNAYFEARMAGKGRREAAYILYQFQDVVTRMMDLPYLMDAFRSVGGDALYRFFVDPSDHQVRVAVSSRLILLHPDQGHNPSGFYKAAQEFLRQLYRIGDILAASPILVDSHEKRPKLVTRLSTPTELGALLGRQDAFRAFCRIASEQGAAQHQLVTDNAYLVYLPSDPETVKRVAAARIGQLTRVARHEYAKPRWVIDQQIAERAERLQGCGLLQETTGASEAGDGASDEVTESRTVARPRRNRRRSLVEER